MNADDVVRFLREHPDFLSRHGDIFAEITVPHPHGGQAITLAERQLHALRDKIRLLEGKLAELIRYGEENDEIGEKVHRLSLALLEAEDFEAVRDALFQSLRDDFSVPHVAMRIWNSVLTLDGEDFLPVSDSLHALAVDMRQPSCGAPGHLEVLEWLGEAAPHVRSVALVPLRRDAELHGMLVLASEEAQRFYPEMGTLYLARIGELAASALRRLLG
jgi:uncharacterized protein YigA (DUF484 family)